MKVPQKPPELGELIQKIGPEKVFEVLEQVRALPRTERYLHWDKLKSMMPPEGLSTEAWWVGLKLNRGYAMKEIPLKDTQGQSFQFMVTDFISEKESANVAGQIVWRGR